MKRTALIAALVALGAATPASAGVWADAIKTDAERDQQDTYELALRFGDDHVLLANVSGGSISERRRQLQQALEAYQRAADARPDSAEPYFRIAESMWSFYFDDCRVAYLQPAPPPFRDCSDPSSFNTAAARILVAAWDAAEARAPLDPRFSAPGPLFLQSVLFDRAILNTRIATTSSLAAARRDYEAILARSDIDNAINHRVVWNNLAETLMMLGDLDAAIDAYREACHRSSEASTWYGYAVALDRAGDAVIARKIIAGFGVEAFERFDVSVKNGDTFFVPDGEKFYYYGLVAESLGDLNSAVVNFERFIDSGAHPMYQPRARDHLKALIAAGQTLPLRPNRGFRE